MSSTIAVWGRRAIIGAPELEIGVHINLWRHERTWAETTVLDLGFWIPMEQQISRLQIWIPLELESDNVQDLAEKLRNSDQASAVFNEDLSVPAFDDEHVSLNKSGVPYLTVLRIKEKFHMEHEDLGTLITTNDGVLSGHDRGCDKYIRFRIAMNKNQARTFISDLTDRDRGLVSHFTIDEVAECRVNEVRSIPASLRERARNDGWIRCKVFVNYFLIRNANFDLLNSHAPFRKIRKLEPNWSQYLDKKISGDHIVKMIIYHWKEGRLGEAKDSFVGLSKFRRRRRSLLQYLLFILVTGLMVSASSAAISAVWSDWLAARTAVSTGTDGQGPSPESEDAIPE